MSTQGIITGKTGYKLDTEKGTMFNTVQKGQAEEERMKWIMAKIWCCRNKIFVAALLWLLLRRNALSNLKFKKKNILPAVGMQGSESFICVNGQDRLSLRYVTQATGLKKILYTEWENAFSQRWITGWRCWPAVLDKRATKKYF